MIRYGVLTLLSVSSVAANAWGDSTEAPAMKFGLAYTADVMGVVDGGLQKRTRVLDNLDLTADFDFERLGGLRGLTAHVDALNNSGAKPNNDVGSLQGVDNIEVARPRFRLFEAWLEQGWDGGSLRAGLYDMNSEFYANESAGLLMAPAFGVGSEISATGVNGPSIFPSTALAARLNAQIDGEVYARFAVLNADARTLGDPRGVDTSFDHGALAIAEGGIEGAHKLAFGVWRYTHRQDDIRDVDAAGAPAQRIAQGAYMLFEQPLTEKDALRATSVFFRAGVSDGDTTPFAGGWQAGVLVSNLFESRPDSQVSLGVDQGVLSDKFIRNQVDSGISSAPSEYQIELTYADKIGPVSVQPDLQWVRRPGGDRSIKDALVAGLRLGFAL